MLSQKMQLHLQPFSLFVFPSIFIFSPLINIQTSLCTADYRFHNCSQQLDCGVVNGINYPFWGVNRANYCGEPGYHVDCKNNVPKIRMMSNTLRILQINNEEKILKVARDDLWDNICPTHFSNTSVDFKRFSYAPGQKNLSIYYDCISPSDPHESYPYFPQPECVINETRINVFYMPWYVRDDPPGISCNSSVIVPFIETNTQGIQGNNLRKTLDKGFNLEWNLSDDQCETCVESGGFCGYNSSMENRFVCFCRDQPYRTRCPFRPGSTTSRSRILIPLGATVAVITTIVCICLIVQRRKFNLYKITFFFGKQSVQDQKVEAFVRSYGFLGPQRYSYYDVKKMTNVFSNKLGQGGFGDVYKGVLPDGRLVAVKLLKESKGDGEEFINEVASISRTSHVNIVTFLGFCFEEKKRALVYEFMPNGSLDKYIYDHESSTCTNQLGWNRIFQIGVGIARGLEYLHRGCNTRIVHFDIKPHNILLDEDFCPKISDFGLSKLCKSKESIISMLGGRGTPGYIAPEVFNRNFGKVSHKSDVYSYGMMIIEMVGGRRNMEVRGSQESEIYFADWIYRYTEPDNEIHGVINEEEKELAKKMILVSLWCIQAFPSDRPSISKVVEMLEGSLEDLQIPPKPSLSSLPRSIRHSSSTLVSESLVSALVIEKDPLTN